MLGLIVGIELAFFKAMGDLEAFTVSWGYDALFIQLQLFFLKSFLL